MNAQRIDIHTHLIPPFWAEELKSHGGDPSGWGSPEWSPDKLLQFMDNEEIAVSILSLTAPGIEDWQRAERIDIARRINDYGAELVRSHPDRFGYLATLALPDVEAGLAEIARALDDLGADAHDAGTQRRDPQPGNQGLCVTLGFTDDPRPGPRDHQRAVHRAAFAGAPGRLRHRPRDVLGGYPYSPNAKGREFLNHLPLAPADRAKLAHGNADRLLKLRT